MGYYGITKKATPIRKNRYTKASGLPLPTRRTLMCEERFEVTDTPALKHQLQDTDSKKVWSHFKKEGDNLTIEVEGKHMGVIPLPPVKVISLEDTAEMEEHWSFPTELYTEPIWHEESIADSQVDSFIDSLFDDIEPDLDFSF